MTAKSCKKPVYARMCEDENGNRTGKYRNTKYESRPKKTAKARPKVKTVRKTPAKMMKAVPVGFDDPRTAYDMAADRSMDDIEELMEFAPTRTKVNAGRKEPYDLMLQKMYLKDVWMKRQASKRKKTARRA